MNQPPDDLKRLGDMMLAFGKDVFPRGYLKDVYVWDDGELSFAWVMSPEKLRRLISYDEDSQGYGHYPVRHCLAFCPTDQALTDLRGHRVSEHQLPETRGRR